MDQEAPETHPWSFIEPERIEGLGLGQLRQLIPGQSWNRRGCETRALHLLPADVTSYHSPRTRGRRVDESTNLPGPQMRQTCPSERTSAARRIHRSSRPHSPCSPRPQADCTKQQKILILIFKHIARCIPGPASPSARSQHRTCSSMSQERISCAVHY